MLNTRAPGSVLALSWLDTVGTDHPQLPEMVDAWLTETEQQHFSRFAFPKRQSEWLSGRICAKRAILDLLSRRPSIQPLQPRDITISIGPTGRPEALLNQATTAAEPFDVSISHSHGKAIGIAGYGRCGVDIQFLNDTLFRVKQRFCSELEGGVIETITENELTQLGLLWVSKEAIRKCLSDIAILGFLDMRLERIDSEHGFRLFTFQPGEPFTALGRVVTLTHSHDNYALAVCTIGAEQMRHAGIA